MRGLFESLVVKGKWRQKRCQQINASVFHTVLNVSTKKVIGKGIKKGGSHQLLWYSHSVVYSKYCPLLSSYMILEIDKKNSIFLAETGPN